MFAFCIIHQNTFCVSLGLPNYVQRISSLIRPFYSNPTLFTSTFISRSVLLPWWQEYYRLKLMALPSLVVAHRAKYAETIIRDRRQSVLGVMMYNLDKLLLFVAMEKHGRSCKKGISAFVWLTQNKTNLLWSFEWCLLADAKLLKKGKPRYVNNVV